ncbi:hypothetical protein [Virgisporangium aliadipatigenens]|uniref:hypothetical protein n=1 Tax=Virgisporangium aliadipatigenens TaxID=741659 RepID=UPI0019436083|nr:hypothetical protein [Virgisporangium aliadipatigenens]
MRVDTVRVGPASATVTRSNVQDVNGDWIRVVGAEVPKKSAARPTGTLNEKSDYMK